MLRLGRRDRLGYTRLKGELRSYRIELQRAAERVAAGGEETEPSWLDDALSLLDQAEDALERNAIEEGWSYLHTARRVELDGLMADERALGVQAAIILAEANGLPDMAVRRLISTLVTDGTDQAGTDGARSVTEIRAARYLLDREYQQTHLRRRYVQEQFSGLTLVGVGSITLFVLLTLAGGYVFGGSASPFAAGASQQPWFLVYVLVAGTIGASLFGIISSIRADPRLETVPQTISSGWMVTARVLTGAMSAFVLYLFVQSGIVNFGESPEASVLLIALAAGYSERLAPRALAAVSEQLGSQLDRDERTIDQLDSRSSYPRDETPETGGRESGPTTRADATAPPAGRSTTSGAAEHEAIPGSNAGSDDSGEPADEPEETAAGPDESKPG